MEFIMKFLRVAWCSEYCSECWYTREPQHRWLRVVDMKIKMLELLKKMSVIGCLLFKKKSLISPIAEQMASHYDLRLCAVVEPGQSPILE